MSNIQTYKYTLMKKSSIIPKNQSIEKDTNLRVLKVKTDYSNRLQNESSTILTKNIEKIYT